MLNNLGSQKGAFADLSIVDAMLAESAKVFIENALDNLSKADAINTGELSSSLTFTIERKGGAYILSIGYPPGSKAAKYYDFVNKGVAGVVSNNKGATGDYKFKTPYPNKPMATMLLLWYRSNSAKVGTRDAQKYTQKGIETKGKRLKETINKVPSLKQLAYATATKIKKEGLRPTHFFDEAIESSFNESFREAISAALKAEVTLEIRRTVKEF